MLKQEEPTYQRVIWPWKTKNWSRIKQSLTETITNFVELDAKIASLRESKTRPRLLHELFDLYYSNDDYQNVRIGTEVLFKNILPTLQQLVLDGPRAFKNFSGRVLTPGRSTNITITRRQAAIIAACVWFGLFEYDYITPGPTSIEEFSEPTFMYGIEAGNVSVLQFILSYFERLHTLLGTEEFEDGILIIQRARMGTSSHGTSNNPDWSIDDRKIITPTIGEGRCDDTFAPVQIAYAHQFIGGDLFKASLTQEELTLLIRPECLSMLIFCARLNYDESVCIYGAEKFSQYSGIGSSIRYLEKYGDTTSRGRSPGTNMLKNCIVFIDATQKSSARDQAILEFDRDLNKAFCGINMYKGSGGVASGNWSYGFNGSNMQVKFIQLLLAASAAGRSLEYHPIGKDFEKQLLPFIDWLIRENISINELYNTYKDLMTSLSGAARFGDLNIFESLMDTT